MTWFGVGMLVVTGLTVGLNHWAGTRLGLFPIWAILRAVVQLGVIALLLRGILSAPWTVAGLRRADADHRLVHLRGAGR